MTKLDKLLTDLDACSEAREWAKGKTLAVAWRTCSRGDWMLWLAGRAGVRRQDLVLAACASARLSLKHVKTGENRPLRAIEAAEDWAKGGTTTLEQVRAAAAAAAAASYAASASAAAAAAAASYASYAAYAASSAAYAAAADAASYAAAADAAASSAASSAAYAAAAAASYAASSDAAYAAAAADADAADAARRMTLAKCAALVRKHIPYSIINKALAGKETK